MQITLEKMLERLGIPHSPRFSIEQVAEILGIRRDQVLDLIKRHKLLGVKATASRWSGVFAIDLAVYIEEVNTPKTPRMTGVDLNAYPDPDPDPVLDMPVFAAPHAPTVTLPTSAHLSGREHIDEIPRNGKRDLGL